MAFDISESSASSESSKSSESSESSESSKSSASVGPFWSYFDWCLKVISVCSGSN